MKYTSPTPKTISLVEIVAQQRHDDLMAATIRKATMRNLHCRVCGAVVRRKDGRATCWLHQDAPTLSEAVPQQVVTATEAPRSEAPRIPSRQPNRSQRPGGRRVWFEICIERPVARSDSLPEKSCASSGG
jgi:uncharacterized Zn finger protein (UPF0148 family)